MSDAKLSLPERTAILALMSVVEETSNTRLRALYGFAIDGAVRTHLVEYGFVTSRRDVTLRGQPFVLELTELGWRRGREELAAKPPANVTRGYRVLYGTLNCIDRYLAHAGLAAADFFVVDGAKEADSEASPAAAPTDRIRAAYEALAGGDGLPVGLRKLRDHLNDLSPAEFDAAIVQLIREPGVYLESEPKRRNLTSADHAAAIRVGGEDKHLLSIERP